MFNSREYGWNDLALRLGGRDVVGLRALEYGEQVELEALYAKGGYPHSIQEGNTGYEGKVTMLLSEYNALVVAGGGSVARLNLTGIATYGNPDMGDPMQTDTLMGIRLKGGSKKFKQGDKFMEVEVEFMFLRIIPS